MVDNENINQQTVSDQNNSSGSGTKTVLTGALVALLFLVLGIGIGFILFKSAPPDSADTFLNELQKTPVVASVNIVLAGTITEINDRDLTLERSDETMVITIRANEPTLGKIINPDPEDPNGFARMEDIALEDIKIGDSVSVSAIINNENMLEGVSVTVLPDKNALPRIN